MVSKWRNVKKRQKHSVRLKKNKSQQTEVIEISSVDDESEVEIPASDDESE